MSAGHTEIVQALISGGADVNAANTSGQTALHYAVSFLLLMWSAQAAFIGNLLHMVLHWLLTSRNCNSDKLLTGVCITHHPVCAMGMPACNHHNALQVSKGRIPLIQMLLQAGAKVNAKDTTGSTPLHRYVNIKLSLPSMYC